DVCHHTPLHLAAARGERVTVKMLLQFGSDPTFCSSAHSSRHSPLDTAASLGHDDVVRAMCASIHHRATRKPAAKKSFMERIIKSILAVAVAVAAKFGQASCVDALVEAGADVEAKAWSSLTPSPIHLAARGNGSDAIAALVRHGADVNSIGEKGRTPLHTA
ncbi:unnamed protein product, partial [Hapterophycus canaliculatus]